MAEYENLKLTKQNFTVDQGYFYMFDQDQDSLLQKTDDGNTSFSYPFDILMDYDVLSAEYDGVYFWSLEDPGGYNITIRRWKIDNYICKLQKTFNFVESGSHKFNSEAFSIEHYHTTLSSDVSVSGTTLLLNKYSDHYSMDFTTTSGNPLILHLGPNSNDEEEDVQVGTTISGEITLASGTCTSYAYASSDKVNYYTNIWMFNDYNGLNDTGALYKFDAYTGDYLAKYESGTYKDVSAATFYNVDSFTEYGDVDTLAYVKSTNTLFIDVSQGTLPHYGSMVMDNVEQDEATLIIVYDMVMDDQNVYRLQKKATYYGVTGAWTNHNYQLSSLDSFVTSISLAAYPAIIAANQVSTSNITAIVKDQFLQPIVSRNVKFEDDDNLGFVDPINNGTDSDGKALTVYKSGNQAREVKITAVVEQS